MRDIANTSMTNNKQILVKPVHHLSKCPRSRRCQYVNFIPQWGRGRQLQSGLLARKTIQNKYNSDVSVRIDQLAPPIRLEFVKMVEKFLKHLARDRVSSSSKELIVYDLEHNSLTFNLCITNRLPQMTMLWTLPLYATKNLTKPDGISALISSILRLRLSDQSRLEGAETENTAGKHQY